MRLIELITLGVSGLEKASDIHLVYGIPPQFRIGGKLTPIPGTEPLTDEDCMAYAREIVGEGDWHLISESGELDLARTIAGVRLRINVYWQQGHLSAAIRLLNMQIPSLDSLGLPPVVSTFTQLPRGIVLVTGVTGSGKSTTLAALLERINETQNVLMVTLEDPIEYLYTPKSAVISQREIGKDTKSYATGLRAILREDPDIILIGEMRDPETIEIALTAAETGHLVFATLHTASAADSIDRIVDAFPADRQSQIRMQLSQTLKAVLSQQLLPRADGTGRVCACEVMIVTPAIKNLIREGKTPQIASSMATSADLGSIAMDHCLAKMASGGIITAETARRVAREPDNLRITGPFGR